MPPVFCKKPSFIIFHATATEGKLWNLLPLKGPPGFLLFLLKKKFPYPSNLIFFRELNFYLKPAGKFASRYKVVKVPSRFRFSTTAPGKKFANGFHTWLALPGTK